MEIEGIEINDDANYLDLVTYVPKNATSPGDCERGVIIGIPSTGVNVLYCNDRSIRLTNPDDLVWG